MPAKLTLHPPQRASRFLVIRERETLVVGRGPECGLVLGDPRVSRQHAVLRWSTAAWLIEDLGSKNGTCVNGVPAAGQVPAQGDWISFGGLMSRFQSVSEAELAQLDSGRLARLRTTAALRRRLAAERDPFDLLLSFLKSAMEMTGAEQGLVLVAGGDGRFHAEVASGFTAAEVDARVAGSSGALARALETGASVVVSDAQADPFLARRPSVVAQALGTLACVPLRHERSVLGLLYVDSRRPGAGFTTLDVEMLESLAQHTALVIAGMRLERRIRELFGPPGEAPVLEALERQLGTLAATPEQEPGGPG